MSSASHPASPPAASARRDGAFAAAGAIFLALTAAAAAWHLRRLGAPAWPLDDAYITLHNARALIEGDPSFPGVPALFGATSLLHTLAVAAGHLAGSAEWALWALSWAAVALSGLGVLAAGRALGLGAGWSLALALASVFAGRFYYVMLNGLETGWVFAIVIWMLALAARDPFSRGAALLCGLAPFVRPELGAVSVALMLGMLSDARREGRRAEALRALAWCVAPASALLAAQWSLSGAPLPRTGFAKRAFFAQPQLGPWIPRAYFAAKASEFIAGTSGLMLALAAARGPVARRATLAALALIAAMAALYPVVSIQNGKRLLWVFLPIAAFALASRAASGRGAVPARVFIALALAATAAGFFFKAPIDLRLIGDQRARLQATARWIERNLDPSAPLLLHDVGHVAWATDVPLVDLVGLKTPFSQKVHARLTARRGPEAVPEATEIIARRFGARTMLTLEDWEAGFRFAEGLRARGWRVTPLSHEDLGGYVFHAIVPPEEAAGGATEEDAR
ncbi:hypothetical protein [Oceanicella actignis]|uniref:Glycosyltransferase RgtA/B/C/D-like domain-containing protein n=1 Tax=Oceanicella actignis TaxID=1189325 RepID=A0A1M7TNX6_9RHOB|nr:hypothetical protein [Oceanicella actignis]SET72851.1 hypothetical protein SAMN04488119_10871 [Oceanicella actignis]SHN72333.1 hypothetical protein SAMN05216200_10872 [Oceanicella actignis]